MRERKGTELINAEKLKSGTKEKKAPRARNRTVMLNASETAKVRSKFQSQNPEEPTEDGFISPQRLKQKSMEESIELKNDFEKDESDETVFLEEDSYEDVFDDSIEEDLEVANIKKEELTYLVEPDVFEDQVDDEVKELEVEELQVETLDKTSTLIKEEISLKTKKVFVNYTDSNELLGFLVYKDMETELFSKYIELRKSRLIVTSIAPKGGEYIFIDDESVSPMHAVLRISDNNSIQILDQLSENGTKIIKAKTFEEIELLGDKSTIEHGDQVIFGNFICKTCLIL